MTKKRELPLVLKRTNTKTKYTTEEVTEILMRYGIVSGMQGTQRFIRAYKNPDDPKLKNINGLKAEKLGKESDFRLGHVVVEASLYSFIVERIPAVAELWDKINKLEKAVKECENK